MFIRVWANFWLSHCCRSCYRLIIYDRINLVLVLIENYYIKGSIVMGLPVKWMVYDGKSQTKMGYPYFRKPLYIYIEAFEHILKDLKSDH